MKFFILALLLISSAEGLEFVKLELPDGEECKIDLREYPTENAFDPFPETEFCDMREVLLFEETFLGHVRVANAGMGRAALRFATEGSVLFGVPIGAVLGCVNGKFPINPVRGAEEERDMRTNRIFISSISALFSFLAANADVSKRIPFMERIAPRDVVLKITSPNKIALFKNVPAGVVGYGSSTLASHLCEEDDESLQTTGIIDYRLRVQD